MQHFKWMVVSAIAAFFMVGGISLEAEAKSQLYKPAKGSILRIAVTHPAKLVKAKAKRIKGKVFFAADGKGKFILKGALSVRIKSIRSGNRRRDRAMWSALRKARQPYIYFYPESLTWDGKKGAVSGTFKINRKKKKVSFAVTKMEGTPDGKGKVTVKAKGHLLCSDFGVKRPSLLFVKIKNKVALKFSFIFKPKK